MGLLPVKRNLCHSACTQSSVCRITWSSGISGRSCDHVFNDNSCHLRQKWGHRRRTDRYDGLTLKKIRGSRTDETPWPQSSTCLFLALVKSNTRRIQLPSLRHGENFSRQACTPVNLHNHKIVHPFNCTPVSTFRKLHEAMCLHDSLDRTPRISCSLPEYPVKPQWGPWQNFYFDRKGSIHKYTRLVMLTHYSALRGWLPSVTLGHKQNQTIGTDCNEFSESMGDSP